MEHFSRGVERGGRGLEIRDKYLRKWENGSWNPNPKGEGNGKKENKAMPSLFAPLVILHGILSDVACPAIFDLGLLMEERCFSWQDQVFREKSLGLRRLGGNMGYSIGKRVGIPERKDAAGEVGKYLGRARNEGFLSEALEAHGLALIFD